MAKTKVSEFDAVASNNTDINSVNVAEGCPPSGINNAIREMASLLKKQEVGTDAMTSPDIDGGTIDGATIGGSSGVTIGVSDGTVSAPSIKFTSDTNTGIYRGGTDILKFVTAGTDAITIDASQDVTLAGSLNFADNEKSIFGAGSDLQIYHDGSNSIISDVGTGNLQLRGTNIQFMNGTGSQTMAFMFESDAVQLRHNNVTKLATTSSGIDVTGTVTADALTLESALQYEPTVRIKNTNPDAISAYLVMQKDSASPAVNDVLGTMLFQGDDDAANATNYVSIEGISSNVTDGAEQGTINIKTAGGGGSLKTRITADGNGDISFYEDTGTTPKLFWDSSAEALGIGTSSPNAKLHVNGSADNVVNIQVQNTEGTGSRLDMYAFGSSPSIQSAHRAAVYQWTGSGIDLWSRVGDLHFGTSNSERMRIDSSGHVGIINTAPANYLDGELVVGNSTKDQYISVVTGTGNAAGICFQDTAGTSIVGGFRYTHLDNALASWANGAERMRIDSSGNLLVGTTSDPGGSARLGIKGSGATDSTVSLYIINSSSVGNFLVYDDGKINTGTTSAGSPYNSTTGTGANAVLAANGFLQRSTSSLRYKNTVLDATNGLAELLKLRPVTFKGNNDGDHVFGGLIAEEVHDAGLTEFVQYDDEDQPDALHYGNMVSLCIKAIQELKTELDEAKARIVALENA